MMPDINKIIGVLLSLFALIAAIYGFSKIYATYRHVLEAEMELRSEIIDVDVKTNNEARVYYEDLATERPLSPAEQRRLNYIRDTLERKYKKQERIQKTLIDLEVESN